MTAGHVYTVAGDPNGNYGSSGDGGPVRSSSLGCPTGLAIDSSGDIYIADSCNQRVQEIAATTHSQWGISMTAGDIYTAAGGNGYGNSGDAGSAVSASLENPNAVVIDSSGNLYISDSNNNQIQEVAASTGTQWGQSMTAGDIYTVAGDSGGSSGNSGDGTAATSALLTGPDGLALDSSGDLYIADWGNNRVQELAASTGSQWGQSMTTGDIYTVAGDSGGSSGNSGDGGAATSALLNAPVGVALDSSGDLYIGDEYNNRIQEVAKTTGTRWGQSMTAGDVYTVAGSSTSGAGDSGDGGAATSALLQETWGMAFDAAGDLYLVDSYNGQIQEVPASTGTQWGQSMTADDIYSVAGPGPEPYSGDGDPATAAYLNYPHGVAVDSSGDVYIADTNNNRIQEVAASTGTQWGISMTAGDVYTIAGDASGSSGNSGDGAAATSALLNGPSAIAVDSAGNVYISDGGNNRVQEIASTTHTQWGISMTAGDIYTVAGDSGGSSGDSGDAGTATSALLNGPSGITVDAAGNLYLADFSNNQVQEVAATTGTQWGQSMTAGDIYTIAGDSGGSSGTSGDGGAATSALLQWPDSVAVDSSGNLYFSEWANNRVQEVPAISGTYFGQSMTADDIYTVAGDAAGIPGDSGEGQSATDSALQDPVSVVVDSAGDLYISEWENHHIDEVAAVTGTQWGQSMTTGDFYVIAGDQFGVEGDSSGNELATNAAPR